MLATIARLAARRASTPRASQLPQAPSRSPQFGLSGPLDPPGPPNGLVGSGFSTPAVAVLAVFMGWSLTGCGGSDAGSAEGGAGASTAASSELRRDGRAEAVQLRRLLDEGRTDLAAPMLEALEPELGLEGPLLRARLVVIQGDRGSWLKQIEVARAMNPADPRPYATAAELYAAIGLHESALDEITRGMEAVGSITPELQRAQGIYAITTVGGGKTGLLYLESALKADPGLPFMGRPLGQAYLLSAQRAMAEGQGELALERVQRSLQFDPADADARRTYAEIIIAVNRDFSGGIALLEQLLKDGEQVKDLVARMSWSAGVKAQVAGDRGAARKYYLRARELGCVEAEQGMAKTFFEAEARGAFDAAVVAATDGETASLRLRVAEAVGLLGEGERGRYTLSGWFLEAAAAALSAGETERAGQLAAAARDTDPQVAGLANLSGAIYLQRAVESMGERDLEGALLFAEQATLVDPDDAMAHHLLGELRYAAGRFAEAVPELDRALRNSELDGEPLGLEVALMLARCQEQSGQASDAIATLDQYLRRPATADDASTREEASALLRSLRAGG